MNNLSHFLQLHSSSSSTGNGPQQVKALKFLREILRKEELKKDHSIQGNFELLFKEISVNLYSSASTSFSSEDSSDGGSGGGSHISIMNESLNIMILDLKYSEKSLSILLEILSLGASRDESIICALLRGVLLCTHHLSLDLFKYLKRILSICCSLLECSSFSFSSSSASSRNVSSSSVNGPAKPSLPFRESRVELIFSILDSLYSQSHIRWAPYTTMVLVSICSWWKNQAIRGNSSNIDDIDHFISTITNTSSSTSDTRKATEDRKQLQREKKLALHFVGILKNDFPAIIEGDLEALSMTIPAFFET